MLGLFVLVRFYMSSLSSTYESVTRVNQVFELVGPGTVFETVSAVSLNHELRGFFSLAMRDEYTKHQRIMNVVIVCIFIITRYSVSLVVVRV